VRFRFLRLLVRLSTLLKRPSSKDMILDSLITIDWGDRVRFKGGGDHFLEMPWD
jgi:hypothetical protein